MIAARIADRNTCLLYTSGSVYVKLVDAVIDDITSFQQTAVYMVGSTVGSE